MITTGTLDMPLRTPQQALADSLAALRRRLPVGSRAVRMDGAHGVIRDVIVDGGMIRVTVVLDDSSVVTESAGYWSRSSL